MKSFSPPLAFSAVVLFAGLAAAADQPALSVIYSEQVDYAGRSIVSLAEAMPAEKYAFAPENGEFKGVRTFAEQVKHVAAVTYMVAAAALNEKPPVDTNSEKGPDSLTSKAQIVDYLKSSFAYAQKAARAINEKNQLEMIKSPFGDDKMARGAAISIAAWHTFDHYGQMVVYARMNGIVPPASRQ
jgi:uncharacterized damage-inducible protein DinB